MNHPTSWVRCNFNSVSKALLFTVAVFSITQSLQAELISSVDIAPTSTIRHDRADALYTAGAALFPATGRLTWPGFLCSGNFIGNFGGSGWVLTAGHCVDDGTAASQFDFLLGGTNDDGAAIFPAPTSTNFIDSLAKGDDIALVRLVGEVVGVAAAVLNTGTNEVGMVGTHVGFGRTGTGLTGDTSGAGTKRAAENVIDALGNSVDVGLADQLIDDFDNPLDAGDSLFGSSAPLNLEGLIAPGDSGGGYYVDFGFGFELVGIHSFNGAIDGDLDSDYGDLSGSTRVSSFVPWINATTSAVPEPSSLILFAIAGAFLYLGRKNKQKKSLA